MLREEHYERQEKILRKLFTSNSFHCADGCASLGLEAHGKGPSLDPSPIANLVSQYNLGQFI